MVPLRVSDGFKSYVLDQLDELGAVTPRLMFGGIGLYRGDVFFGIIAADVLYLKVDDSTRSGYERAHSKPFMPYGPRRASSHYWSVPIAVLENSDELTRWATRAIAAAEQSRKRGKSG